MVETIIKIVNQSKKVAIHLPNETKELKKEKILKKSVMTNQESQNLQGTSLNLKMVLLQALMKVKTDVPNLAERKQETLKVEKKAENAKDLEERTKTARRRTETKKSDIKARKSVMRGRRATSETVATRKRRKDTTDD